MLKSRGYEVVSAMDGVEALDNLHKEPVDMIISDILMPKIDGFQLIRECKSDENLKNIPFIFYTATYTSKEDEEFAIGLGADKFVVKPMDPEKFLEIIENIINNKKVSAHEQNTTMDESVYLNLYNERLVKKLDHKVIQLEKATKSLQKEIIYHEEMEAKLLESEQRLKLALKAGNQGLWDWDITTGDLYLSVRWKTMLGYTEDEIPDQISSWENLLHPDDVAPVMDILNNYLEGKTKTYRAEFRLKTKNCDWKWILGIGQIVKRDENGKPLRMVGTHTDISKDKKILDKLEASVEEKRVMLQEIHHRVKNNMQIISSLLSLQSLYVKDKYDSELFIESKNRVKSMAMVHEKLYLSKDMAEIAFEDYINSLISQVFSSYNVDINLIKILKDINGTKVNINTAVPLGLILNELLNNSIKHAFPDGHDGEINIGLHKINEGYVFVFSDNGIGLSNDINIENPKTLGLQLINSLVGQLDGIMDLDISKGTKYIIKFKDIVYTERI